MSGNNSPGKIIKKTREDVGLAGAIGSKKHSTSFPGMAEGVFTETMGQGDAGGYPTQYPLKYPAVNYGNQDGATPIDIDLTKFFSHVTRITLTGNLTITLSNPPAASKAILIFFEITQDAIGGRTILWSPGLLPVPVLNSGPNEKTLIAMFSTDQGVTWHTQVFGATSGGGSGEVFTWTASHSAEGNELLKLGKLQFESTLNFLQITREGTAPGYDVMGFEAPTKLDYFINRSLNPVPRFSITQNSLESNVKLVMNDKEIQQIKTAEFGNIGSVLPTQKEIVGTSDGLIMNITQNKKFKIVGGSDPSDTLLEVNDLSKQFTTKKVDIVMESGKVLRIEDTVSSRSLVLTHSFGEQNINASNAMHLQVAFADILKLDTKIRAKVDIDLENRNLINAGQVQIPETLPANTIPGRKTDTGVIFARPDVTTGKTQLRVVFATGTSQLIAAEP